MAKATKILYDVADAIKKLHLLNKKVEESGDKASESFDKGGESADKFDEALERVDEAASDLVAGSRALITNIIGIGAVTTVAAGAVAAIAVQFLDLDGILKDSILGLNEFNDATQAILDTRESISNIGDQATNRDLRLAQRSLRLAKAENARSQNSVEVAKNAAKARLAVLNAELREREALVKASSDREQALQDKLDGRNKKNIGDGFAGPIGKKALDLGAAARQAAFEGDIELAEELEALAKKAGAAAGNHALFLKDQASTQGAINRKLEEQIALEDSTGDAAAKGLDAAQARIDKLQAEVDLLEKRSILLRQETRELGAQGQDLKIKRQEAGDQQQADTAARTFEKSSRDFQFNVTKGGQSFKETVLSAGSDFAKFFTNEADRQAALAKTREAGGAAGRISQALNQKGGLTASDVERLSSDFGILTDVIAELGANRQRLSSGQEKTLDRLELLRDNVEGIFNSAASFRQVTLDDQVIAEGAQLPTAEDTNALRNSILELTKAIPTIGTRASAIPDGASGQSRGTPPAVSSAPSNITVNATVKGGIIDAEVTQKITEIIRRELRKQTTPPTQ